MLILVQFQSRLLHAQKNLGVAHENLAAATARIRDTDMAQAAADLAKNNLRLNITTGVLAQANQTPQLAMKLLG